MAELDGDEMVGPLISPEALVTRLGRDEWVVFDCRFDLADTERGRREFGLAHIPGARYAHVDENLSSPITADSGRHPLPDPGRLADWLGSQGVTPASKVVVYDDTSGSMASRLWWLLRWLGHEDVALLDGGWACWVKGGWPTTAEVVDQITRPPLPIRMRPELVVTTEELAACGEKSPWLLLDARTPQRFRGESEPIDPVAGHIPGSRNLPLQLNLDSEGRFRPARDLAELYRSAIGDHSLLRVACLCGSGVTACHNLLAMELAGLRGARLYAGSWSEWIRDPLRPVATGSD